MVHSLFLAVFLFAPVVIEGIGVTSVQASFILFYLMLPAFLFGYSLFTKKIEMKLPPAVLSAFFAFLTLSGVSALTFSLDKQLSFERLLFFISLGLVFLFSYNHKKRVEKLLSVAVPWLGIIFLAYSLIAHSAVFEKQVVFATYGSHNHLGDFMGAALIVLASHRLSGWKSVVQKLLMLVFFLAVIFSYSRSAYAALSLVILFVLFIHRERFTRAPLIGGLIALTVLFTSLTLVSSAWIRPGTFFSSLQTLAIKNAGLIPHDMLSGREIFFTQAVESVKKYPLFGVGGGNFYKASLASSNHITMTDSAHNLFLDLAVEQGIPATVLFAAVCLIVVVKGLRKKSLWGLVLAYFLINFQTDYTYQILLFLQLSALVAGVAYDEDEPVRVPIWVFGALSTILFFAAFCMVTSGLFVKMNRPLTAIKWYPFNKTAYSNAISQATSWNEAEKLSTAARMIAPADIDILYAVAESAFSHGQKKEALILYERMYEENRLINFSLAVRIYQLKKDLYSKIAADAFLTNLLIDYRDSDITTESFRKKVGRFCNQNNSTACANTGWFFKE